MDIMGIIVFSLDSKPDRDPKNRRRKVWYLGTFILYNLVFLDTLHR
jgi:hypothetical protein